MSRPWTLSLLIVTLAIPVSADNGTRIRLENGAQPGSRVTIAFADAARTPARLEVGEGGVAELVVEAPSPRRRLRGGSLRTDPMIAAMARRHDRESSSAPNLLVLRSVEMPLRVSPDRGPLVYDEWGGFAGGYWGGASRGGGSCDFDGSGRLWDIPVAREIPRRDRAARPAPPASPRGSYSARAVVPRMGGRR